MIGYDLTSTWLASADFGKVPAEGELLAILMALMLLEGVAFSELSSHEMRLTPRNRDHVAALIRHRLAPLARDFKADLHERLDELTGLKIIVDEAF